MTKIDYIRQKARIMSQTLEDLLPGYDCDEGRNPIAACAPLPAEAEVIRVVKLIDSAFYPGYREERASAGCTKATPAIATAANAPRINLITAPPGL